MDGAGLAWEEEVLALTGQGFLAPCSIDHGFFLLTLLLADGGIFDFVTLGEAGSILPREKNL